MCCIYQCLHILETLFVSKLMHFCFVTRLCIVNNDCRWRFCALHSAINSVHCTAAMLFICIRKYQMLSLTQQCTWLKNINFLQHNGFGRLLWKRTNAKFILACCTNEKRNVFCVLSNIFAAPKVCQF